MSVEIIINHLCVAVQEQIVKVGYCLKSQSLGNTVLSSDSLVLSRYNELLYLELCGFF